MRQLVKSMVNWNIYNDNILTRVFARLENSRSSQREKQSHHRTFTHHRPRACVFDPFDSDMMYYQLPHSEIYVWDSKTPSYNGDERKTS